MLTSPKFGEDSQHVIYRYCIGQEMGYSCVTCVEAEVRSPLAEFRTKKDHTVAQSFKSSLNFVNFTFQLEIMLSTNGKRVQRHITHAA